MSAGKGPQIRKGADLNLYWQNYDQIFRKEESDESKETLSFSELKKIEQKCCGGNCCEKKDT